jgi:hypothetical protein
MRDQPHTPSLFENASLLQVPPQAEPQESREEKRNEKLARDFLRWCCSFGRDFRNSPDITNLRFWIKKARLKLKPRDEADILRAVRPLFIKHLEQLARKSDGAK